MKSNSVIETSTNGDVLTLKFSNGSELLVDPVNLSESIKESAMLHGLKQKLCDAAAMSRNPETGKPATVEEKYAAVREVYDRLFSGEWNAKREGNGATGGMLYRALLQLYPSKTPADIRTWLDAKSKDERAALAKSPKIAAIIDTLRTPKASSVDVDALFDELS